MVSQADILALAQQYQQGGNLVAAEQLYLQILHSEPSHAESLHFLGVLKSQAGDHALALEYMQQALALRPEIAHFHSNLGLVHFAQGQLAQAESCLRQALRIRPEFAQAHSHLGAVYYKQGRRVEAIACYREALRYRPDDLKTITQLGIALYEQEAMAEALAAFQEARRINPYDGQIHKNVGLVLCRLGRLEEAVASSLEAVRLCPEDADVYNNLANALVGLGRVDEAVAAYRESLCLVPQCAEIMSNLASALVSHGKLDEALDLYRRALELKPSSASVHYNLSELLLKGEYAFSAQSVRRLQELLSGDTLSLQEQSLLHFTLGGWLAKAGRHGEAFEHFRQANMAQGKLLVQHGEQFDQEAHVREVDSIVATCDRNFFSRVKSCGIDSEVPVFVVGMPRSGTTLVEQILSSHPQVFGAGELTDIDQMIQALPALLQSGKAYPACLARLDREAIQALGEQYVARLGKLCTVASRVVNKEPYNFMHLGLITALFPRARIIHCRRDPLDTCVACYFQRFERRKNYTSAFAALETVGLFYRDYYRIMAHWQEVLPVAIHEIHYEDLVRDQRKTSQKLIAFCGLEWDEALYGVLQEFSSGADGQRGPSPAANLSRLDRTLEILPCPSPAVNSRSGATGRPSRPAMKPVLDNHRRGES